MKLDIPALIFLFLLSVLLPACSGGGSGSSGGGSSTPPGSVTISGKVTFDLVPFSTTSLGRDYDNVQNAPARGVRVRLLDESGNSLSTTVTDDNGDYSFSGVDTNVNVRVRVLAQMETTSLPVWNVEVLDNTTADALYVLDGGLVSSGEADSVRNLHAASGWSTSSSSYTGTRAAAPFAILDVVYESMMAVANVDASLFLNDLDIFWSPNNRPAQGDLALGEILSSFYTRQGSQSRIYLLGAANEDADEYDRHVIAHEWSHFFEDTESRSDTIGGSHGIDQNLDLRLAFSEGLANAFSAIALNDASYKDFIAQNPFAGNTPSRLAFDLEDNTGSGSQGWFVERSIQSLIYDFYDSDIDASDTIALGFAPIYNVLTSSDYRDQRSLTSVFSFVTELLNQPSIDSSTVNSLLAAQQISGVGIYGIGESNHGGDAGNLPVYTPLTVGITERVCTSNFVDEVNKLGVRKLISFTVSSTAQHNIIVSRSAISGGIDPSAPAFNLYRGGQLVSSIDSMLTSNIAATPLKINLIAGDYVLEVFSQLNTDNTSGGGSACFDVSVIL